MTVRTKQLWGFGGRTAGVCLWSWRAFQFFIWLLAFGVSPIMMFEDFRKASGEPSFPPCSLPLPFPPLSPAPPPAAPPALICCSQTLFDTTVFAACVLLRCCFPLDEFLPGEAYHKSTPVFLVELPQTNVSPARGKLTIDYPSSRFIAAAVYLSRGGHARGMC